MCGFAAVEVMGRRVPEERIASVTGIVPASIDRVWELVSDTPQNSNWRTGIHYLRHLDPQDGEFCWEEQQSELSIPFCIQEQQPPFRQVIRMTHAPRGEGPNPFRGIWIWDLEPDGPARTRITITEHTRKRSPVWRFIEHYVTKEDSPVKQYLKDLQAESVRQR
ncbi:hypothetical protein GRAN_2872 [Granulicella sibirica]|uniref:Uncharacterized protein n=2 Tax=Granulicella sibirica TaxID=2479048 RepID=A0A4Q0SXY9_9BACT|nr:hypothetical protein GRAN_2872 [Granulicella sibirica]